MLQLIKKLFFTGLAFSSTLQRVNPLKYISLNNQSCKVKPQIVNGNSDEPVFFPFSIKRSKCSATCNNINDSYAKLCVPDVVKNLNVRTKINAFVNTKNRMIKEL